MICGKELISSDLEFASGCFDWRLKCRVQIRGAHKQEKKFGFRVVRAIREFISNQRLILTGLAADREQNSGGRKLLRLTNRCTFTILLTSS